MSLEKKLTVRDPTCHTSVPWEYYLVIPFPQSMFWPCTISPVWLTLRFSRTHSSRMNFWISCNCLCFSKSLFFLVKFDFWAHSPLPSSISCFKFHPFSFQLAWHLVIAKRATSNGHKPAMWPVWLHWPTQHDTYFLPQLWCWRAKTSNVARLATLASRAWHTKSATTVKAQARVRVRFRVWVRFRSRFKFLIGIGLGFLIGLGLGFLIG